VTFKPGQDVSDVTSWPLAVCESCGKCYPRPEAWARTCLICFKNKKGFELVKGDLNFLWAQTELERIQKALAEANQALAQRKAAPSSDVDIDPETLKNLIKLCHPDKHDNSETATRATQFLLEIRDKQRKRP